jgi:hypothetical protein
MTRQPKAVATNPQYPRLSIHIYDDNGERLYVDSDFNDIEVEYQQTAYYQNQIDKNYPLIYIIIHNILMILLSGVIIVLQIIATSNNIALSYLLTCLWVGLYNIATAGVSLLTSIQFGFINFI